MNRIKHIVFLRRLPQTVVWGGLEKLMMDWFERIDYKVCRVTLAISPGGKGLFERRFAEKRLPIEIIEFNLDLYEKSTKLFSDMYKFLKPLKPSIAVFIQGAFTDFRMAAVVAAFLCTYNNVYIHENLGVPSPLEKSNKYHLGIIPKIELGWFKQRFINILRAIFSRKIFVVSQEIKNQLVELWGYPVTKVIVSYHGIDLQKFCLLPNKRQQVRQTLNIPMSDFVFIIPARLSAEKRIDRAIEAFDRLSQERNHIWLLILGDGNLRQELQRLAFQKASKDRIIFLGHQGNVAEYLNAADCYINSSDTEGLSIALLESMASGLICSATNCTGSNEVIQNSQSGFLVEKNAEGVFKGMKKALSLNAEEREILIHRGIQFITRYFDLNQSVKRTLDAMQISNTSCNIQYDSH